MQNLGSSDQAVTCDTANEDVLKKQRSSSSDSMPSTSNGDQSTPPKQSRMDSAVSGESSSNGQMHGNQESASDKMMKLNSKDAVTQTTDNEEDREEEEYKNEEDEQFPLDDMFSGIDLGKIAKDRVEKKGPLFQCICLPFDHSTEYVRWTKVQVAEWLYQFMSKSVVVGFWNNEIKGSDLVFFPSSFEGIMQLQYVFRRINKTRPVTCFNQFALVERMITAVQYANAGINMGSWLLDMDRHLGVTAREIGTQTCRIETCVDKMDPENAHVEVGRRRRNMKELKEEKQELFGNAFENVPLPFDHDINVETWNHEQFVEWVAQFLPKKAVHAIANEMSFAGNTFKEYTEHNSDMYMRLNVYAKAISFDDFLEISSKMREVHDARMKFNKEERVAAAPT